MSKCTTLTLRITACLTLTWLYSTLTFAQQLENRWTGDGDGISYEDSDNWDLQVIPCNEYPPSFLVFIPEGKKVIFMDGQCEVNGLTIGNNATFEVKSDAEDFDARFKVLEQADLCGTLIARNAEFTICNPGYDYEPEDIVICDRTSFVVSDGGTMYVGIAKLGCYGSST